MNIGIIGAMIEEVEFFLESIEDLKEVKNGNTLFYTGTWHEHHVTICKCGVGKVNAAMTAQLLIDKYEVETIIFTGVAGALDQKLNIQDVVISTSCQEHDIDASPLGFPRGTIPMYDGTSDFPADKKLIDTAYIAANEIVPNHIQVWKGKIVSGDQFIANREEVNQLKDLFSAICVEMEGAAVAHVANFNHIPYVVLRSISDKANGEAPNSFETFVKNAAKTSAEIVERIVVLLK
ncbi:5'-methylthioadenosine/adenosylhomocysteine nucleosidase [Evansella sp. AB-rgal1]|uniref:5'-methylthioadenosine/adenosylhomocysteine nucleosidase n=1 Tax=Evansella sp. AB-rgal1 TaxID=3242696 RepID=UPI00359D8DC8